MFEAGLGDSEARAESDVSLPSSLSGKDIRLTSKVAFHDMAACHATPLFSTSIIPDEWYYDQSVKDI